MKHPRPRYRLKPTVTNIIRAVVSRMNGVFHVSEVKREVWKIKPGVHQSTISTNLHNLVHRFGELESPTHGHYKRKTI